MVNQINKLPDDILNLLLKFKNLKCHTCLVKINNLKILNKSIIVKEKFIFCCKECYNYI